jgi:hypothetical protein
VAPVFIPIPGIGLAVCCCFGNGSDPVGKILFTNRNRAESTIPDGKEREREREREIMSRNKPTGPQKGSVQKKMDWKAVEIVHPDAAGIDVGGSEHWVAVSPDRDRPQ